MLTLFTILFTFYYAFPALANIRFLITGMTLTALLLSSLIAINSLHFQCLGSGITVLYGSFNVSAATLLLAAFMLILASIMLFSFPIVNNNMAQKYLIVKEAIISKYNDYFILALFSTIGSFMLMSATNLIVIYLAVELQSFGVYLLAAMSKESNSSTSAGLKYFLLGSLASCIILLGLALIYASTGLIYLDDIYALYSVSYNESVLIPVNIGLGLIVIGLLFKIASAPLHFWAPDVYQDTPTIVTMWLTIMPKIAILLLLLELQTGFSFNDLYSNISIKQVLLLGSAASLIVGSIMGLSQLKLKRLLAYSTISHVGFLLLVLAINSEESTNTLIFYIVQYSLTNLLVFLALLHTSYTNESRRELSFNTSTGIDLVYITDLRSLIENNFWIAFTLIVCLFSFSGIPPLPGFFAKQGVLLAAAQESYYFMALICILVSTISATYYLKIIVTIFSVQTDKHVPSIWHWFGEDINPRTTIYLATQAHSYIIATLTVLLCSFIFNPTPILAATQLVSLSIY